METAAAAPSLIKLRLAVLGAILFAYFVSLAPLRIMGREGFLLAAIVGLVGLPLLLIAVIVGTWAAPKIIESPWTWAFAAGLGGIVLGGLGWTLLGGAFQAALLGLPVAILGPVAFRGMLAVLQP